MAPMGKPGPQLNPPVVPASRDPAPGAPFPRHRARAGPAVALLVAAVLVVPVGLAGCADDPGDGSAPIESEPAELGPSTALTSPETEPEAVTPPATWAVGSTRMTVTEPVGGHDMATQVRYPATATGPDAAPAGGTFPLVLMAHGHLLNADGYGTLLDGVAARGYVVAASDFPHTSTGTDGNRADLPNAPRYLATVADAVVADAAREGSVLPTIAHPEKFAVMGHADGALAAAAMAYNADAHDERVESTVVMSGGRGEFGGPWSVPRAPALLAIHGRADEVNPIANAQDLLDSLPDSAPRHLVTIDGGDHIGPYVGDTALGSLPTVIADFLDVHLLKRGELSAVERLHADASVAPLSISGD